MHACPLLPQVWVLAGRYRRTRTRTRTRTGPKIRTRTRTSTPNQRRVLPYEYSYRYSVRCHKCFCVEMCFACSLFCRNSRFATRYGRTVAMPSPRISRKNENLKILILVRFCADNYIETETDYAENTRKSLIAEKVVSELYFQLVVVPEEFDFSV